MPHTLKKSPQKHHSSNNNYNLSMNRSSLQSYNNTKKYPPRNLQRKKIKYAESSPSSENSIHVEKVPKIQIKDNCEIKSQINVHFKFKPIKAQKAYEQQIIKALKIRFSERFGKVSCLRNSLNSAQGYLAMELGFQEDQTALLAYERRFDSLFVVIKGKQVPLQFQPSRIFQLWMNKFLSQKQYHDEFLGRKAIQIRSPIRKASQYQVRTRQNKLHEESQNQSMNRSERSRSRNQEIKKYEKHEDQNRRKIKQNFHNIKRQPQQQYSSTDPDKLKQKEFNKKFKPIQFLGLHYCINAKEVAQFLQNHPEGPFKSRIKLTWKRVDNSICEYLYGEFELKMADKLLKISDQLEIRGHSFIVINSQSQTEALLKKMSEFQVNLKFPWAIKPYYVLKALKRLNQGCKVIQIISNNEFQDNKISSSSFNISLNSKQVCRGLKSIKVTVGGIVIDDQNKILIYRSSRNTSIRPQNSTQLQDSQIQQVFSDSSQQSQSEQMDIEI